MHALLPSLDIPKQFTLSAVRTDGDIVVTFKSPKGERELGRYAENQMSAAILAKVFPEWTPPAFVQMMMSTMPVPKEFTATAHPEGQEIVLQFNVPALVGKPGWPKQKRVKMREWDLAQMSEMLHWAKEAHRAS